MGQAPGRRCEQDGSEGCDEPTARRDVENPTTVANELLEAVDGPRMWDHVRKTSGEVGLPGLTPILVTASSDDESVPDHVHVRSRRPTPLELLRAPVSTEPPSAREDGAAAAARVRQVSHTTRESPALRV